MKKLIVMLLVGTMSFSLCSCGSTEGPSKTESSGKTESQAVEDTSDETEVSEEEISDETEASEEKNTTDQFAENPFSVEDVYYTDENAEEETSNESAQSKKEEKICKIGDTTSNDDFEMTLLSAEFADAVNTNIDSENFCMPMSEEEKANDKEHVCSAGEGYTLLCFTYKYKFIGKKQMEDTSNSFGLPYVVFGDDYSFGDNSVVFQRNEDDSEWHFFAIPDDVNWNWQTISRQMKFDEIMTFLPGVYRPLEDITYTARGFIIVPEKVRTETDSPVRLEFNVLTGGKYSIR